jgi:hypothetical protein
MKTITLSDHTNDKLRAYEEHREHLYQDSINKHNNKIREKLNRRKEITGNISKDLRSYKILSGFGNLVRLTFNILTPNPAKPVKLQPSNTEIIWASGNKGENRAFEVLNKQLSEEWTAIKGYRNAKGEIDLLTVGPYGIIAMEIKYINGTIYCDGDKWWKDKFDRYGNLVETLAPITDKKGRTPSMQVNEAADILERYLKKNSINTRIYRMVIFSHKLSKIKEIKNKTVDYILNIQSIDINKLFFQKSTGFNKIDIEKLIYFIKTNHNFYNNKH